MRGETPLVNKSRMMARKQSKSVGVCGCGCVCIVKHHTMHIGWQMALGGHGQLQTSPQFTGSHCTTYRLEPSACKARGGWPSSFVTHKEGPGWV